MSLITKYRPDTFAGVVGNADTIEKIKAALDKPNPKRTFLLTGPKGTGKTTIARIIAKYIGCDMEHNFREIDSADFRGIDTARELIKDTNFTGMGGGVKVYLMDEAHKLTKDAQEALLKTLEEPPAHIFFILATTDPQKLVSTLVDRCMPCHTSPMPEEDGAKFIKKIARREGKQIPDHIIELILDKGECRPRTCLSMLEQIIAIDDETKMEEIIKESSAASDAQVIDLCRCLLKATSSWSDITKIVKGLEAEQPESIRRAIMGYMNSILMKKLDDTAQTIMECFENPFFNNGKADLTLACARAFRALH